MTASRVVLDPGPQTQAALAKTRQESQRLTRGVTEQAEVSVIDGEHGRDRFSVGQVDQTRIGKINVLVAILREDTTNLCDLVAGNVQQLIESAVHHFEHAVY